MEHSDAQALLELAAVEPHGFSRLAAGDTAEAAALASHLAGCPACAAEFERLGRLAPTLRDAVRALPSPELRELTLALVATTGRARAEGSAAGSAQASEGGLEPSGMPEATPGARSRGPRRSPRAWVLATAASLVVAVAGVAGWWSVSSDLEREQVAMTRLAEVTEAAVRVGAQPDAAYVGLAAPLTGGPATAVGEVVLSATGHEIVVLADGLDEPPAGMEYRCWVETGGVRQPIGRMYLYGGLATWAGWSDVLEDVPPGAVFGVSLVDSDGAGPGQVLLSGQL